MNGSQIPPSLIGAAILVDEVGLESGVFGQYRLRSAYQPIFERRGPLLVPIALEGLVSPQLSSEAIAPDLLFGGVQTGDRPFVEAICRAIHVRNHRNCEMELDLWFHYDPWVDRDFMEFLRATSLMAGRLPQAELDPQRLVCEISEAAMLDLPAQSSLVARMRGLGTRMAIDGFGGGESSLERIGQIRPDVVRMDGDWFHKLCSESTAIRLLASLISGFRQRGTKILIGGIESAAQLGHALACNADFLQGAYLARPALVGTAFQAAPLSAGELLRGGGTVVPLFQGPCPTWR